MNVRSAIIGLPCLCGLLAMPACRDSQKYQVNVERMVDQDKQNISATVESVIVIGEHDYEVQFKTYDGIYRARFSFISDHLGEVISSDKHTMLYLDEMKRSLLPGTKVNLSREYFDINHIGIFSGREYHDPQNRCPAVEISPVWQ